MRPRRIRVMAVVGAGVILSACTDSGPVYRAPSTSIEAAPPPTGDIASDVTASLTLTLTCADAGAGSPGEDFAGTQLGSLRIENAGVPPTAPAPLARDVGLRVPDGATDWRFIKSPVYVPAEAASTTLELAVDVDGNADGQALAWVPAAIWTGGTRPDLRTWMTRSVTFQSCPDRDAAFFGGFLADAAHPCIVVAALSGSTPMGTAQIRFDGSACGGGS